MKGNWIVTADQGRTRPVGRWLTKAGWRMQMDQVKKTHEDWNLGLQKMCARAFKSVAAAGTTKMKLKPTELKT
jgi:hypothetical protein